MSLSVPDLTFSTPTPVGQKSFSCGILNQNFYDSNRGISETISQLRQLSQALSSLYHHVYLLLNHLHRSTGIHLNYGYGLLIWCFRLENQLTSIIQSILTAQYNSVWNSPFTLQSSDTARLILSNNSRQLERVESADTNQANPNPVVIDISVPTQHSTSAPGERTDAPDIGGGESPDTNQTNPEPIVITISVPTLGARAGDQGLRMRIIILI